MLIFLLSEGFNIPSSAIESLFASLHLTFIHRTPDMCFRPTPELEMRKLLIRHMMRHLLHAMSPAVPRFCGTTLETLGIGTWLRAGSLARVTHF